MKKAELINAISEKSPRLAGMEAQGLFSKIAASCNRFHKPLSQTDAQTDICNRWTFPIFH